MRAFLLRFLMLIHQLGNGQYVVLRIRDWMAPLLRGGKMSKESFLRKIRNLLMSFFFPFCLRGYRPITLLQIFWHFQ